MTIISVLTIIYCFSIFIGAKRRNLLVNAKLDRIRRNFAGAELEQHDQKAVTAPIASHSQCRRPPLQFWRQVARQESKGRVLRAGGCMAEPIWAIAAKHPVGGTRHADSNCGAASIARAGHSPCAQADVRERFRRT
ncbi:hypothetical protein X739_28220 [Mesorhizobium sp. LNHC220B00]|nr:hypothetical protein X739_28220 [Mesorhizobium sp. LNHC220B00]